MGWLFHFAQHYIRTIKTAQRAISQLALLGQLGRKTLHDNRYLVLTGIRAYENEITNGQRSNEL